MRVFLEVDSLSLKFKWKNKQVRLARKILKKESNKEGLTLVGIKHTIKAVFGKSLVLVHEEKGKLTKQTRI